MVFLSKMYLVCVCHDVMCFCSRKEFRRLKRFVLVVCVNTGILTVFNHFFC